jgi:hypothetical protein
MILKKQLKLLKVIRRTKTSYKRLKVLSEALGSWSIEKQRVELVRRKQA